MKKITFIFPVYNESEGLDKLYSEMLKVFDILKTRYVCEMICVNDGSKDASLDKLIELHEKDNRVNVINFSRNFGQQIATTAGLDFATGDAVIIMDADLQDPPMVCIELIQKWEEGYDVVYAQRRHRKDPIVKKIISHWYYRILQKLTDIQIPRDTGDFRLMDKKVVKTLNNFREKNRFIRGIVSFVGFKQTGVLYDKAERYAGDAKFTFGMSMRLAMNGIMGFSTVPLKLITQFGFFVSLLSIIGIIYAVVMRIFYPDTVSGFTFIVVSILFIGGVQMIMLGILGSYIGRIYSEVQNRPLYIVESVYSVSHNK